MWNSETAEGLSAALPDARSVVRMGYFTTISRLLPTMP